MPAAKDPAARDYPVRKPFRRKERNKTGIDVSVAYDPEGENGWPGAKAWFTGVPGSDEVEALLHHPEGPLLYPIPDEAPTSTKEN